MNAPLARLSSLPADTDQALNRRREPRFSALAEATIVHSGGLRSRVMLVDISCHGCSFVSDSPLPHQGAFVSIGLDQEPMLTAVVRWIRGNSVGMEFLRPIPSDRREWRAVMDGGY